MPEPKRSCYWLGTGGVGQSGFTEKRKILCGSSQQADLEESDITGVQSKNNTKREHMAETLPTVDWGVHHWRSSTPNRSIPNDGKSKGAPAQEPPSPHSTVYFVLLVLLFPRSAKKKTLLLLLLHSPTTYYSALVQLSLFSYPYLSVDGYYIRRISLGVRLVRERNFYPLAPSFSLSFLPSSSHFLRT